MFLTTKNLHKGEIRNNLPVLGQMENFLNGFFLQSSLILGLGAQNIFVLESGLKKQRHHLVATVCSICDALLIAVGVIGAATIFVKFPLLKISFGIFGIIFLVYYGARKLYEGITSKKEKLDGNFIKGKISAKKVIMLSLWFSLLNPHVYLDTVVLIGGYSAKYPDINDRMLFGLGASTFSILWFFGLAEFSSAMGRFLKNENSMRYIQVASGIILLFLSYKLSLDVLYWFKF